MANIKINNLQPSKIELRELSHLELEGIVGGGWFEDLTGIRTPDFLRRIDDVVRDRFGGWTNVIKNVVQFVRGIKQA